MGAFISVYNSREIRATVLAIHAAPAEIRKAVRTENRTILAPQWVEELEQHATTTQQSRVLVDTARVKVSDQSVTLTSASSRRRALSGGLRPVEDGKGFEFGADRQRVITYTTRRGRTRRHTTRQMPYERPRGFVFYPAYAEIAPRALALWAQTSLKIIADAIEGRRTNG